MVSRCAAARPSSSMCSSTSPCPTVGSWRGGGGSGAAGRQPCTPPRWWSPRRSIPGSSVRSSVPDRRSPPTAWTSPAAWCSAWPRSARPSAATWHPRLSDPARWRSARGLLEAGRQVGPGCAGPNGPAVSTRSTSSSEAEARLAGRPSRTPRRVRGASRQVVPRAGSGRARSDRGDGRRVTRRRWRGRRRTAGACGRRSPQRSLSASAAASSTARSSTSSSAHGLIGDAGGHGLGPG